MTLARSIACAAAVLVAAACAGDNTKTTAYATYAEARTAGAVDAGWLPGTLPPGTRDIRVGYRPGTDRRWGLFNFPAQEAPALKDMLQPGEVTLDGVTVDVPGRIEWWPPALRGNLDGERLGFTGLKAYRSLDGALIVAVNWNQGRAFYWNAR